MENGLRMDQNVVGNGKVYLLEAVPMGTNGTIWTLSTMVTAPFGATVIPYLDFCVLALKNCAFRKKGSLWSVVFAVGQIWTWGLEIPW